MIDKKLEKKIATVESDKDKIEKKKLFFLNKAKKIGIMKDDLSDKVYLQEYIKLGLSLRNNFAFYTTPEFITGSWLDSKVKTKIKIIENLPETIYLSKFGDILIFDKSEKYCWYWNKIEKYYRKMKNEDDIIVYIDQNDRLVFKNKFHMLVIAATILECLTFLNVLRVRRSRYIEIWKNFTKEELLEKISIHLPKSSKKSKLIYHFIKKNSKEIDEKINHINIAY